jgi:hypothetical protein
MPDLTGSATFEHIQLQVEKIGSHYNFSEELLTELLGGLGSPLDEVRLDGTITSAHHPVTRTVSLMYRATVAYLKGTEVTCPVSWVDHLKERIVADPRCPAWLARRLKPTIRRHTYQARLYLPNYRFPKDSFGPRIIAWHGLGPLRDGA